MDQLDPEVVQEKFAKDTSASQQIRMDVIQTVDALADAAGNGAIELESLEPDPCFVESQKKSGSPREVIMFWKILFNEELTTRGRLAYRKRGAAKTRWYWTPKA